jgi:NAD(P)-dependent dehydrogenase (short-subunit alcohol dehydrogenase family)
MSETRRTDAPVAVVVGCAGALGQSVASALSLRGVTVVGVDVIPPAAVGTALAEFIRGDVHDGGALDAAAAAAARHGDLRHVLCLVGDDDTDDVDDLPAVAGLARLRDALETRVEPLWLVLSSFETALAAGDGTRSVTVRTVTPGKSSGPAEAAAAGAVAALTRVAAGQFALDGVRVNAVAVPDTADQDAAGAWLTAAAATFASVALDMPATTGQVVTADTAL